MNFNDRFIRDLYHEMYWVKEMSLNEMVRELKIPLTTLYEEFERLGLRTRSKKAAQRLTWKKRFKDEKK